jgi:hypothetical protein
MFTVDSTVDTVQGAKKQFVKTFVQNETAATAMNEFIDHKLNTQRKLPKLVLIHSLHWPANQQRHFKML